MKIADIISESSNIDERAERLAELISDWIEIDPLYTNNYYSEKSKLSREIVQYEDIASNFRRINSPVLYRGIGLRRPNFVNGFLVITPRKNDVLESWTTDETYAYEHASQFPRGIVIECTTETLPIFIDIWSFMSSLGENWTNEGEVIVRSRRWAYRRFQEVED